MRCEMCGRVIRKKPEGRQHVLEFVSIWRQRYAGQCNGETEDETAARIIRTTEAIKLARLFASEGLEKFRQLIVAYIADDDPWLVARGHGARFLDGQLDRIRVKLAGRLPVAPSVLRGKNKDVPVDKRIIIESSPALHRLRDRMANGENVEDDPLFAEFSRLMES